MNKRLGFTLIELVIVMGIMGILAAGGIFSMTASFQKTRDLERKTDLKQIQAALEMYANENNGSYPSTTGQSSSGTANWICSNDSADWFENIAPDMSPSYIKTLPLDPKATPNNSLVGSTNYSYCYFSHAWCGMTAGSYYILTTRLENTNDDENANVITLKDGCTWNRAGHYTVGNP